MIVVKVELVSAKTGETRELGRMIICNDATGTEHVGHYYGTIKAEYGVRGFRRRNFMRQTQSVWTLIGSILSKLGHVKGVKDVEEVRP